MFNKFGIIKIAFSLTIIFGSQALVHASPVESNHLPINFNKSKWTIDHDLFMIHAIPKCGTHYIQRTINLMTHQQMINTNARDGTLRNSCSNNQILRTCEPYNDEVANLIKALNYKVVSMIRDPRDALISHVFYMRAFSTPSNPGDAVRDFFIVGSDFDEYSLEEQITKLIIGDEQCQSYIDYYKARMGWALNKDHLMVRYEELVGAAGSGDDQIKKQKILDIAHYINLELSEEHLEEILNTMYMNFGEQQVEGKTFTRSSIGNWKNFLTPEHKKLIKERIGQELILLGYDKDLEW